VDFLACIEARDANASIANINSIALIIGYIFAAAQD
jgi:hypothetical protein